MPEEEQQQRPVDALKASLDATQRTPRKAACKTQCFILFFLWHSQSKSMHPTQSAELPTRSKNDVQEQLDEFSKRMSLAGKISQQDLDNLMKEEKIRIAMQKLAQAQLEEVCLLLVVDKNKYCYNLCIFSAKGRHQSIFTR